MPADPPRVAVCIGRLQPVQRRHVEILSALVGRYDRVLLVCGGVTEPPSLINPWTVEERRAMLALALPSTDRLALLPVADCWYDDARWAGAVRAAVSADCAIHLPADGAPEIDYYGLERQDARAMATHFDGWQARSCAATPFVDALPEQLLGADPRTAMTAHLPAALVDWLAASLATGPRPALRAELDFTLSYRAAWGSAPFPPVFVTVDALVTHAGRVLLVRRGHRPGQGLLALPGGFIDVDEPLCVSALRELREETGLTLTVAACTGVRVFDNPLRSLRGRTITHLHRFPLADDTPEPAVQAGDDAADALWLPFDQLRPAQFFEDHYAMLQVELGLP